MVQSGTGFLKSESFDGELGFKTDNVSWHLRDGGWFVVMAHTSHVWYIYLHLPYNKVNQM